MKNKTTVYEDLTPEQNKALKEEHSKGHACRSCACGCGCGHGKKEQVDEQK